VKLQSVQLRQAEFYERTANQALDDMREAVGLPVMRPMESAPRWAPMNVTFNNINVSNSQIATLNTGSIGAVDSSVTVLRSAGHGRLGNALKELVEAVITAADLNQDRKNEILELLGTLSEEATVPKERQRKSLARTLMARLTALISGATAMTELWKKAKDLLEALFGS
jgi:hypothetical protein